MKIVVLLMSCLLGWPLAMMAQNQVPEISNVQVKLDEKAGQVQFVFDVSDAEEEQVMVHFSLSDDSGQRFIASAEKVTGDVGQWVKTGTGKSITWNFDPSQLNLNKVHFRLVADDGYRIPMEEILAKVDTNRMKHDSQIITIHRNHKTEEGLANLEKVRTVIEGELEKAGMSTRRQEIRFGSLKGENVLGKKAGLVREGQNYVLVGHFDSVPSRPGNVISTSGILGFLELIRVLSEYQYEHSVVAAAFDMNYPEFRGANSFIWEADGFPSDETMAGAFLMGGIGSDYYKASVVPDDIRSRMYGDWPQEDFHGHFTFALANEKSKPLYDLFNEQVEKYVPQLRLSGVVVPKFGEDAYSVQAGDHAPFWYHHYQMVKVTTWMGMRPTPIPKDKTFAEAFLELNSFAAMADIVKATLATMVTVAKPQHCGVYTSPLLLPLK